MADPFSIAMIAVSTVGSFVQAGMQSRAASAQAEAAAQTAQLAIEEQTRQQAEQNRISAEEKGDRARQADAELATLRVIAGERGGLQTNTYMRQVQELGFFEGLDLSRIEANRRAKIAAMQANKEAARQGAVNSIIEAENVQQSALIGATLNALGSGLQIGADSYAQRRYEDILRNRTQ